MSRLLRLAPAFGRFLAVGLSGTAVNLGVLWLMVTAGVAQFPAALVAVEVSIINNFIWNDRWTFKTRYPARTLPFWNRFWRFQIVTAITATLTLGLFLLFSNGLGLHYLLAQMIAIGLATVLNFSVNSWLTWGLFAPARSALTVIGLPLATTNTIAKEID